MAASSERISPAFTLVVIRLRRMLVSAFGAIVIGWLVVEGG